METGIQASPAAVGAIEEALRAFAKALRAAQLYLANNPMRARSLEVTRTAFTQAWQHLDIMRIDIRETEFLCDGAVVYRDAERGTDGLPWLLYRDGLRELQLLPGFEREDMEALLLLLQRARTASPDEDDLVTLLWVADLETVRYRHVEVGGQVDLPVVSDGTSGIATFTSGGPMLAVPAAESPVPGDGPPPGIVRVEDFDTTLYFLDPRELAYLQEEVRREYDGDRRRDVVATVLDIIETQVDATTETGALPHAECIAILEGLLVELIAGAEYEQVAFLLRETGETVRRNTALPASAVEALSALAAKLSDPAVMSQLLQALDETTRAPTAATLEALFSELRADAMPSLFAWLTAAPSSPVRAAVERAATQLASGNTTELVRLLAHEDLGVVRGAIRLSSRLKSPAAVPGLGKVLRSPDAVLRAEAVNALAEIASPGALQTLERAIEDVDRDVRVAVLRAIGTNRHATALPRLAQSLRRKELKTADLSEKMALFEAYGMLCGDDGVPTMDALLNGRSLLGPRETPEMRACAARALGLIGTPLAFAALQRAAETKDVVVRTAVARALRGTA